MSLKDNLREAVDSWESVSPRGDTVAILRRALAVVELVEGMPAWEGPITPENIKKHRVLLLKWAGHLREACR